MLDIKIQYGIVVEQAINIRQKLSRLKVIRFYRELKHYSYLSDKNKNKLLIIIKDYKILYKY